MTAARTQSSPSGDDDRPRQARERRSFRLNLANGACSKLAEQLAAPGLVLPWLVQTLGGPATVAALFEPVKKAGSLAPQLAVSGRIRRLAKRKWAWVGAGCGQAVCLALLGLAAWIWGGLAASLAALALFACFSILSGVGSIAFQDVLGKTIAEGRRGRLLARRALIGGLLTLAAAAGLKLFSTGSEEGLALLLALIFGAALLWALAALAFAAIPEPAGDPVEARSLRDELRAARGLMQRNRVYRRFVQTRGLLLAVELATPFHAILAARLFGDGGDALLLFVFALGLASVLSSPLWGRLADRAAARTMAIGGLCGALAATAALALAWIDGSTIPAWAYMPVFLLVGLGQQAVRLGRKTYLVDGAPEDERPLYVALANTLVGLLALTGGLLGLLVDLTEAPIAIAVLLLLSAAGALAAWRLPPSAEMAGARTG